VYAFFYLCFCSFHVHESWYNENIKILVREIIGPAAAGSAGPVGMPARWMELRSWACGNDAAVLLITLDTCFRAPNTRRCTLCKHEYSQLVLQSKTDWQSNSGKRATLYFVAKLLLQPADADTVTHLYLISSAVNSELLSNVLMYTWWRINASPSLVH